MVRGETTRERSEIQYRDITALNQSAVCVYDSDPYRFYRQFVLGIASKKDNRPTSASIIGNLSDTLLLVYGGDEELFNQHFEDHFALFNGKKGTAQAFTLADELYEVIQDNTIDGEVQKEFRVMFQEAFLNAQAKDKYKGKTWEQGLVDFNAKGKEYFDARMSGKDVADLYMIDTSKRISSQLISDPHLRWIFHPRAGTEVLNKFPIEFPWFDFECKMEADRIHIVHDQKIIQPFDLKTTWDNEAFDYKYVNDQYYIQNGWYCTGIRKWAEREGMGDYEVKPMIFVVADTSINKRRPLIYRTSEQHIKEALFGFKYRGRKYKGIEELLSNIAWANTNNIWDIAPEHYRNNSLIELQTFDEQ